MVSVLRSALAMSMLGGGLAAGALAIRDLDVRGLVAETEALVGGEAVVTGRIKTVDSALLKMQRKSLAVDEVLDLVGLRLRVDDVEQCYALLERVHRRYAPIEGAFDDYIANPKANGYQSLHTAVWVPGVGPTEFQIRTHEMHREAETGAAAHWRYKLQG